MERVVEQKQQASLAGEITLRTFEYAPDIPGLNLAVSCDLGRAAIDTKASLPASDVRSIVQTVSGMMTNDRVREAYEYVLSLLKDPAGALCLTTLDFDTTEELSLARLNSLTTYEDLHRLGLLATNYAERVQTWTELEYAATELSDGIGYGSEEGIRAAVVGLLAHGFNTFGFCEGHTELDRNPFPYIDLKAPGEPCPFTERYVGQRDALAERLRAENLDLDTVMAMRNSRDYAWAMNTRDATYSIFNDVYREFWLRDEATSEFLSWVERSLLYKDPLSELLSDFYSDRSTTKEAKLVLDQFDVRGSAFSVTVFEGSLQSELAVESSPPQTPPQERLSLFQAEMTAFADFLKAEFLEKGARNS